MARRAGDNIEEVSASDLDELLGDPEVALWIDLVRPRTGAKALLQDSLQLNELTLEDCMSPLRMPKIDVFPDGGAFLAAFAVRLGRGGRTQLQAVEVDLLVGSNYLVTVRDGPIRKVDQRLERRIRIQKLPGRVRCSPTRFWTP